MIVNGKIKRKVLPSLGTLNGAVDKSYSYFPEWKRTPVVCDWLKNRCKACDYFDRDLGERIGSKPIDIKVEQRDHWLSHLFQLSSFMFLERKAVNREAEWNHPIKIGAMMK